MGHMVGASGKVVGVDHLEELVSMAATNIGSDPGSKSLLESGVLQLHTCDGRQGLILFRVSVWQNAVILISARNRSKT